MACMQPRHCAPQIVEDWRANVGPERWRYAWPFRSLNEHGATARVLLGLERRRDGSARVALHRPHAREPRRIQTRGRRRRRSICRGRSAQRPLGSAYANFAEDDRGSIETGKLADLVVLSRDVFVDEPAALLETAVEATIVDGEVVYRR